METATIVVFHRCGGKSLQYPPNTLLTARWASEHGAKAIEYDIVACKDGDKYVIAVIEPKLLKQANLDINDLKWSDVQKINTGNNTFGQSKVPLLQEMLVAVDNAKTGHQIHIKGDNPVTVTELLPLLEKIQNYLVTSFDISVLNEVKKLKKSVPVGWIVKPKQEKGAEGAEDLTAAVMANAGAMPSYSDEELSEIMNEAKEGSVDVILLCGPRIQNEAMVKKVKEQGFQVGAWGVGTNIELAKRLIEYKLDRFTLDNPEQL